MKLSSDFGQGTRTHERKHQRRRSRVFATVVAALLFPLLIMAASASAHSVPKSSFITANRAEMLVNKTAENTYGSSFTVSDCLATSTLPRHKLVGNGVTYYRHFKCWAVSFYFNGTTPRVDAERWVVHATAGGDWTGKAIWKSDIDKYGLVSL